MLHCVPEVWHSCAGSGYIYIWQGDKKLQLRRQHAVRADLSCSAAKNSADRNTFTGKFSLQVHRPLCGINMPPPTATPRSLLTWQLPDSDEASDPAAQLSRHAPAAFTTLLESEGELGKQLTCFLQTNSGLKWLSSTLDTWEQWLVKAGSSSLTVTDLNRLILTKFRDFLESDDAKKIASQLDKEMTSGALMIPVYVVEELVKHRLKAMVKVHVEQNKFFYFRFFGFRMALGTTLLLLARRQLLKTANRFGPKWYGRAQFVTDILFPPALWGPSLGLLVGLAQLTMTKDDTSFTLPAAQSQKTAAPATAARPSPAAPKEFL